MVLDFETVLKNGQFYEKIPMESLELDLIVSSISTAREIRFNTIEEDTSEHIDAIITFLIVAYNSLVANGYQ